MSEEEWIKIQSCVANEMKSNLSKFVTPLAHERECDVRLIGSGSFIEIDGHKKILTCQHVASGGPIDFKFSGNEDFFRTDASWSMCPEPDDYALVDIDKCWRAVSHGSHSIGYDRFAQSHSTSFREELVFFYGYAGENSAYGFDVLSTLGTGYCTQIIENSDDHDDFDIFWRPEETSFADGTTEEIRKAMRFSVPSGFSGSLLWNTRYLETSAAGGLWTPEQAQVIGMVQRWDHKSKQGALIVRSVKALRKWMYGQ